jgi:hypothetical protein
LAENNSSNILQMQPAFPNPSKGITCIPVFSDKEQKATLSLRDITGRTVINILNGKIKKGDNKFFLDSWNLSSGAYMLILKTDEGILSQKLMVK